MISQNKWMVIVNPNAGVGKCARNWDSINELLHKYGFRYDVFFSDYRKHALELIHANISLYSKIIIVGGDGTLNEVINGLFTQNVKKPTDIIIGFIPMGSGNDWGKMYGIPENYEEAIKIISEANYFVQDIGVVTLADYHGISEKKYFANIAGIGFDAYVVKHSNKQKDQGRGGKFLYLFNLLTSLFYYKSKSIHITTDDKDIREKIFSMNIGICRYSGGGMLQVPDAIPNDGLFDITIIKKISKIGVISSIKKLYNGRIKTHPKVIAFKTNQLEIECARKLLIEADGEDFGTSPAKFEIIENAIKVIVKNSNFNSENNYI